MIDLCNSDDSEPSAPRSGSGPTDSGVEVIMVAAGPSGPTPRPSTAAGSSSANPPAGSSAHMDDVVITGDTGQVRGPGWPPHERTRFSNIRTQDPTRDLPHPRSDCSVHRLSKEPSKANAQHCPQVRGAPAWDKGTIITCA